MTSMKRKAGNTASNTASNTARPPRLDPAVRECAQVISSMSPSALARASGLAPSTARRILQGQVYRPQNLTIDRLLAAAGFERKLQRKR